MSPTNDPNVNDALGGLLGALLGGHPAVQDHMDQTGKSLDEVLGSISGSQASTGGQQAPGMGDILGALLGSGAPSGGAAAQGAGSNVLGSVLGSMLGGGGAQSGVPAQGTSGAVLSSVLGGLLGGSAMSGQGGMPTQGGMSTRGMPSGAGADPVSSILGGLLGANVGGGASAIANNPIENAFVAPIADALAKKTGMAPGIAQVVVVFALQTLMSGATQKPAQKGFSASDLVNKLTTDGSVSQKYLKDSGLVTQLAQQSGLDQATAAKGLQQTFAALGTHLGTGSMDDKQAALQDLLKSWKK